MIPSTYIEILVFAKTEVLFSENLSWTLENFATAGQYCCQRNSWTVDFVDHTCDGRRGGWTVDVIQSPRTRPSTVMLHYFDLLYTTCSYSCASISWQDFDWQSASRGPSAEAVLLVRNVMYTVTNESTDGSECMSTTDQTTQTVVTATHPGVVSTKPITTTNLTAFNGATTSPPGESSDTPLIGEYALFFVLFFLHCFILCPIYI